MSRTIAAGLQSDGPHHSLLDSMLQLLPRSSAFISTGCRPFPPPWPGSGRPEIAVAEASGRRNRNPCRNCRADSNPKAWNRLLQRGKIAAHLRALSVSRIRPNVVRRNRSCRLTKYTEPALFAARHNRTSTPTLERRCRAIRRVRCFSLLLANGASKFSASQIPSRVTRSAAKSQNFAKPA